MSNQFAPVVGDYGQVILTGEHLTKLFEGSLISRDVAIKARLSSKNSNSILEKFGHETSAICFPYSSLIRKDFAGSCRYRFDEPRVDSETGKDQRYVQEQGTSTNLYFLSSDVEKIRDVKVPLIWTEGEKKHLAMCSNSSFDEFAIISAPGCYGYMYRDEVSNEYDQIPLKDRVVYFVGDSDYLSNRKVFNGYKKLIQYFVSRGAIVHVVSLGSDECISKVGADDFILSKGANELRNRLNQPVGQFAGAETFLNEDIDEEEFFFRTVFVDLDRHLQNLKRYQLKFSKLSEKRLEELYALAACRLDNLCDPDDEIIFDDTKSNIQFIKRLCKKVERRHNLYILRGTLVKVDFSANSFKLMHSQFELKNFLRNSISVKRLKSNMRYKHFPLQDEFVEQIFYDPKSFFENTLEISAIVNLPYVFGYSEQLQSGLYESNCHLSPPINCPSFPLGDDNPLFKVINYLPFKSREDRCDFLGFLVGLFFIPYHLGSHPMLILKGDGPGVNKSTISEIIDVINNKVSTGTIAFKANEDELEKQIATKILKSNVVAIDNMRSTKPISSPLLEKCATDTVLTFRQLGTQKSIERPNDCLFILTLNGGTFSEDILDRSIVIELSHEAKKPDPFPYNGMISQYVKENRDEIIGTLGALIRRAINDESYSQRVNGLHRFNDWANKVKNVMTVNGFSFLENQKTKKLSSDPVLVSLLRLCLEEPQIDPRKNNFTVTELAKVVPVMFFTKPRSAREIYEESKSRNLELQNDLSPSLLGKQLQRLSLNNENKVEFEDCLYNVMIKCLKSEKGGSNKCYEVEARLISGDKL